MTTGRSFLLDENVDVRVGAFLKQEGHDVVFVPKGIRNGEVLAFAAKSPIIYELSEDGFRVHEEPNVSG